LHAAGSHHTAAADAKAPRGPEEGGKAQQNIGLKPQFWQFPNF